MFDLSEKAVMRPALGLQSQPKASPWLLTTAAVCWHRCSPAGHIHVNSVSVGHECSSLGQRLFVSEFAGN